MISDEFRMKTSEIAEEFDTVIDEFADKYKLTKEMIAELITGWLDYNIGIRNFNEGELEKVIFALLSE